MADLREGARNILNVFSGKLQGQNQAMMEAWENIQQQKKQREEQRQFDILHPQGQEEQTFDDWLSEKKKEQFQFLSPEDQQKFVFGDIFDEKAEKGPQVTVKTPGGTVKGESSEAFNQLIQEMGGAIQEDDDDGQKAAKAKMDQLLKTAGLFESKHTGQFDVADTAKVRAVNEFFSQLAGGDQQAAPADSTGQNQYRNQAKQKRDSGEWSPAKYDSYIKYLDSQGL